MGETILDAARRAAMNEGKNMFRPDILNPDKGLVVGKVAGTVYEALWMANELKFLKRRSREIVAAAILRGEDPYTEYASLIEGEMWIKAIRIGEIITVVPAAVAGVAYLLMDKKQTS